MSKFNVIIILLLFSQLLNVGFLLSKFEKDTLSDTNFEEFLNFLYQSKNVQINNNYLSIYFGTSNLHSKYKSQEALSQAYNFKIDYGFLRISPTDDDFIRYLASEGGYLGNVSSHLKPKSWRNSGLLFDAWSFGFNYKNGYGYYFGDDFQIFLLHYGSLDWKKIDFETFPNDESMNKILEGYNHDFRFGTSYEAEMRTILSNLFMLKFNYSENILFRRHVFGFWTLSALCELILQRGIDILSPELIKSIPYFQPIINFAIKTFISAIIYSQRQSNAYYPLKSEPPLRFINYRLSVGISF